jgi:hypothetical protein
MASRATRASHRASTLLLAAALLARGAAAHEGLHATIEGELEVVQLDDFENGLAPGASASTTLWLATGAAEGSHSFGVFASGPSRSGSALALAIVDGTAPSAPLLSASLQKKTQVKLGWSGASDGSGSGIASYRIHREGGAAPADFTSTTSTYVDLGYVIRRAPWWRRRRL